MHIEIEKTDCKDDWTVRLGRYHVPFTSQTEAEAFVEQLQARLQAPHHLPDHRIERMSTDAGWVAISDGYTIHFTSRSEAEAFALQLQARLQAPHPWPASSDESSAAQANIVPIVGPAGS